MRKLLVGALGSLLLALPTLSSAVPMTWTYSGDCDWGSCGDIPTITGTLSGDPELYGSSNELNEYALFGDLTSYSFTLGSYSFSGSSGLGKYVLDSAGNIVGGSMLFANLFSLEFLGVGSANWSFSDKNCHWFKCWEIKAGGEGSYTNTTSVPEPGTLGLFSLAVLAAGFAARRRRVS